MSEQNLPLDLTKPHSIHHADHKIAVYDQNGIFYDSVTLQPLDVDQEKVEEKYALHVDGPQTKIKTMNEKINDVLSTMRASGAVDPDLMSKFESLLKNTMVNKEEG